MNRRKIYGITLVELMIVVVILAIVGTLAYPTYQSHATRARYADAKVMLLQIMQRQREFFTDNNTYTTDLVSDLGYIDAGGGEVSTEQGLYHISAGQCDAGATNINQCVELSAAPQSGQAGDITFVYNSRNQKSPAAHW